MLNRYKDILPYDCTRVQLIDSNPEATDYINASYVHIPDSIKVYIACQNPLSITVHHFWQMIWEQNCSIIVMLNKIYERYDTFKYWPSDINQPIQYHSYQITMISENIFDTYSCREIELKKSENEDFSSAPSKIIYHFAYLKWPDFGVPESIDEFLYFLNKSNDKWSESSLNKPCVVHCSAGVGRTGTYLLVDACLDIVKTKNSIETLDPVYMLTDMRSYRKNLVQTVEQFRFAYVAISRGINLFYPEVISKSVTSSSGQPSQQYIIKNELEKKDASTTSSSSNSSFQKSYSFSTQETISTNNDIQMTITSKSLTLISPDKNKDNTEILNSSNNIDQTGDK
ncbi:hypothetical protein HZS_46, partial [Henneguya salminicola]